MKAKNLDTLYKELIKYHYSWSRNKNKFNKRNSIFKELKNKLLKLNRLIKTKLNTMNKK